MAGGIITSDGSLESLTSCIKVGDGCSPRPAVICQVDVFMKNGMQSVGNTVIGSNYEKVIKRASKGLHENVNLRINSCEEL